MTSSNQSAFVPEGYVLLTEVVKTVDQEHLRRWLYGLDLEAVVINESGIEFKVPRRVWAARDWPKIVRTGRTSFAPALGVRAEGHVLLNIIDLQKLIGSGQTAKEVPERGADKSLPRPHVPKKEFETWVTEWINFVKVAREKVNREDMWKAATARFEERARYNDVKKAFKEKVPSDLKRLPGQKANSDKKR